MASEGSETRARTTTPASMVASEGHQSAVSNYDPQDEVLIRHFQASEPRLDLQESTFLTDCLPPSVLNAVVQRPSPARDLGPANAERLQVKDLVPQLEENPPLFLAERKRDVSFLGDLQALPQLEEKPSQLDPSAVRFLYQEGLKPKKKVVEIPPSLIPERFYVRKDKALLGLEYGGNDNRPLAEREKDLIIFPSERPGKRKEVLLLGSAIEKMLQEARIDKDVEVIGTSQMKKMLAVLSKEQEMNNIFFNELIRQTMVENPDRAEILTALRHFYNHLLDKVPVEVRSLHDEVLAQRALDKKLTDELMRFKATIGVLTGELADIRQHDQRISQQAQDTQRDLNAALAEAKRNSELLEEYHVLYELQRRRLEKAVAQNNEEKETWSTAAYCLALKIVQEGRLNTAKRLHVAEKAWTQMASHFTLILSDLDTEELTRMHAVVGQWRDAVEEVSGQLLQKEKTTKDALGLLRDKMDGFRTVYEQKYVLDGQLKKIPDPEKRPNILICVVDWQNMLVDVVESQRQVDAESLFAKLDESEQLANDWTDKALAIFERHRTEEGKNHPDREKVVEMSQRITDLTRQIRSRIGGDGSAHEGASRVLEVVAEWLERCEYALSNQEDLPEDEWYALDDVVNTGITLLDDLFERLQRGQTEMSPQTLQGAHQWMGELARGIDALDVALVDTVATLHGRMILWMVRSLLIVAPPRQDIESEPEFAIGSELDMQKEAEELFGRLESFSRFLTTSCWDVVAVSMAQKMTIQSGGSDGLELERMQKESDEWILAAKLLMRDIFGCEIAQEKSEKSGSDLKSPASAEEEIPSPGKAPPEVSVDSKEPEEPEESSAANGTAAPESGSQEATPAEAFESFAAMETLQQQFREAHERTNGAMQASEKAEEELQQSRARMAELEAKVEAAAAAVAAIKGKPPTPEKVPALLRDSSSVQGAGRERPESPTDEHPIKLAGDAPASRGGPSRGTPRTPKAPDPRKTPAKTRRK